MSAFTIDITDRQTAFEPDEQRLRGAIEQVLSAERIDSATISLALVGDDEIHRINREFLGHDYPTDVISFLLEDSHGDDPDAGEIGSTDAEGNSSSGCDDPRHIEGELIVSTETAAREAAVHEWSEQDELLLYVVHGLLHLCGYDDLTDEARPVMRRREREIMANWQLIPTGLET